MAARAYDEHWEIIGELGAGGQGKVYEARQKWDHGQGKDFLARAVERPKQMNVDKSLHEEVAFENFREAVRAVVHDDNMANRGALKVLHNPEEARDPDRADERIAREMKAMGAIEHPNLLKILDYDTEGGWFVSEYHPLGTLAENRGYEGDLCGALKAIRPLVEGVACLHAKGIVHRDIKPENIFVTAQHELVLGDFGLVFFTDASHTRVSGTLENVGSRDWMPAWAMSIRLEDVAPTFDVFCLGKLLWSMVSGGGVLPLWYYDRPQFDVEKKFPDAPYIKWANRLFARCIVEEEDQCLGSAGDLLAAVDEALAAIEHGGGVIADGAKRRCLACGSGEYECQVNRKTTATQNFGINVVGNRSFKIYTCTNCGHVQLFAFGAGKNPPAWRED